MSGSALLRAVHAGYRLSLVPARRRFEHAARSCEHAQLARLSRLVAANADTAYGRAHSFAHVHSLHDWRSRVPLVDYEALAPWVQRAASGERAVLTTAPVRIFERTSGSTGAGKLVPYTDALLGEFGAATGPWLHDLYAAFPALRGTRSYWSISPATRERERTAGGIPVGFDDDTRYFGPVARAALRQMLAVPAEVARLRDMDAWHAATARHLVAADDLGLVSVWHPSFFTLLLDEIASRLDELLDAAEPRRAAEVRRRRTDRPLAEALWPRLAVVSCWMDGAAADALPALRRAVPHATVQAKGLLATEGVVSLPLVLGGKSRCVAAVAGHFLEFIDLDHPARAPLLAHELRAGACYSPVLTTAGGFYRYRMGDALRCTGFHLQAPILRFEGRCDQVSDLCGEKLDARLIASAIERARSESGVAAAFALVAPVRGDPPRYRVYAECASDAELALLTAALDRALGSAPGYRYARALSQLAPLEGVRVAEGEARYRQAMIEAGGRAGDVKPTHLDARVEWDGVFGGRAAFTPTVSGVAP